MPKRKFNMIFSLHLIVNWKIITVILPWIYPMLPDC